MALNDRQQRFCEEYVVDLNATQAAIRAGVRLESEPPSKGHYTYFLVDPRNEEIFYVGKGSGRRMFQHVVNFRNGQIDNVFKARRIREIMHSGLEVRACVFSRHKHAGGAYAAERLVIESLGDELTNIAHGNVCSDQKCLEWARYRLTTVVPFCHWLKMNPTLANDPIWYWRIVEGIRLLEKKSLERLAA